MKYLKQMLIIISVSLLGELLHELLPLPVPASIYGIVGMFILLYTGLLKIEQIRETSSFLIEIMPIMFIPPAVGLMDTWDLLRPVVVPVAVISVASTVFVMAVTGRVTQRVIRHGKEARK